MESSKLLANSAGVCVHSTSIKPKKVLNRIILSGSKMECAVCEEKKSESWLCLACGVVLCGTPSDAATHIGLHVRKQKSHKLVIKLADYCQGFRIWCADCLVGVTPSFLTDLEAQTLFVYIRNTFQDLEWLKKQNRSTETAATTPDLLIVGATFDPTSPRHDQLTPLRRASGRSPHGQSLSSPSNRTTIGRQPSSPLRTQGTSAHKRRASLLVSPRRRWCLQRLDKPSEAASTSRISPAKSDVLFSNRNAKKPVVIEQRTEAEKVVGLINTGSSCFLNVIIQCLACCDQFISCLLSIHQYTLKGNRRLKLLDLSVIIQQSTDRMNIRVVLSSLLQDLRRVNIARRPLDLMKVLEVYTKKNFSFSRHQDAQELLLLLFNALDTEFQETLKVAVKKLLKGGSGQEFYRKQLSTIQTPSTGVFAGQWEKTLYRCTARSSKSTRLEPFTSWTLPLVAPRDVSQTTLPSGGNDNQGVRSDGTDSSSTSEFGGSDVVTIESCLNAFTAPQEIEDQDFRCSSHCTNQKPHVSHCLVDKPPANLILHLQRSKKTGVDSFEKIETPVVVGPYLDLKPFSKKSAASEKSTLLYSLYGIICHAGSLTSGHYVAYVKVERAGSAEASRDLQDTWCLCDDNKITVVKPDTVFSSEPYMLFYKRMH